MVISIGVLHIFDLASQPHNTTSRSDWEETYRWRLGRSPVDIKCLHCYNYIRTKVKSSPGPLGKVFKSNRISELIKDSILSFNIVLYYIFQI